MIVSHDQMLHVLNRNGPASPLIGQLRDDLHFQRLLEWVPSPFVQHTISCLVPLFLASISERASVVECLWVVRKVKGVGTSESGGLTQAH